MGEEHKGRRGEWEEEGRMERAQEDDRLGILKKGKIKGGDKK